MANHLNRLIKWQTPVGPNDGDTLVLFLHGLDSNPRKIAGLVRIAEEELAPCRLLVPEMALKWYRLFSFRSLAEGLLERLNQEIEGHTAAGFRRVYIVGHSAGGVLAQVIYLLSRQSERKNGLAGVAPEQIQLVLLAPINRGWSISHHLPITHKIAWTLGSLLMTPRHLLAEAAGRPDWDSWLMQLQRGSPLITWLRLSWLDLNDQLPCMVQLLGSRDEIISWRDMVDTTTAGLTVFFDVPYSNHAELVEVEDPRHGEARTRIFRKALQPDLKPADEGTYRVHSIENDEVEPIVPWDVQPIQPDPNVKRVVFVIHGIRDEGHWTQKIANRARAIFHQEGQGSRDQIAVETSSYGYFSMLQFLMPWEREKKVAWLMDRYIEARRHYPKARFSYIGHSHGTFLVAKALSTYADVVFERVAFAGSVVNIRYPWRRLLDQGRVSNVLNFTASSDWVVGIFPKLAQIAPIGFFMGRELGSAGSDPFVDAESDARVNNNEYIKGSHGAAIHEDNWDNLARFAVCNQVPPEDTPSYQKRPSWLFDGKVGWVTCILAWAAALFLGLYWLPMASWTSPGWFWGGSLAILVLILVPVAALYSLSRTLDPLVRRRMQAISLAVFGIGLLAIVALWLAWPWWPAPLFIAQWGAFEMARAQTLSVVAYFFAIWMVLTRV